MARSKDSSQQDKWSETEFMRSDRHRLDSRHQDQSELLRSDHVASDLEYANNDYSRNDIQRNLENNEYNQVHRNKRHAGHNHGAVHNDHSIEMNQNTDLFIRKIFEKFSNRDTMNLVEFENMVKQLGLNRIIEDSELGRVISSEKGGSTSNPLQGNHSNETVSSIKRPRLFVVFSSILHCVSQSVCFNNVFCVSFFICYYS